MNCKKCGVFGNVVLRRKDHYCKSCFISNIHHKFRACIGKNRAIPPNTKVLVCLSGGTSSTVLLDMVHNGICLNNHKKLRITPVFLHLMESNNSDSEQIAVAILNQCKQYDFDIYMVNLSEYQQEHGNLLIANVIPENNFKPEFQAMLSSMPATVKNDFIMKIKRQLFIRTAEQLHCNYILTAESTATLAINLLSNLAIGRGAQVQNDVSFCDDRHEVIKILRPMKDISREEIEYYIKINILNPNHQYKLNDNSLQAVIGSFVTELQDSFQATISTICKTADKIGAHNEDQSNQKCIICMSKLRKKSPKLTALEATNFSRVLSIERSKSIDCNNINYLEHLSDTEPSKKQMFPFIHERLCYGCSRDYLEMDHAKLPLYMDIALHDS